MGSAKPNDQIEEDCRYFEDYDEEIPTSPGLHYMNGFDADTLEQSYIRRQLPFAPLGNLPSDPLSPGNFQPFTLASLTPTTR